jgi:hypothetical protein
VLGHAREVLVGHGVEEGDAGGLDGDAAILLILAGVGEASLAGVLLGDDTRGRDEGVGQGGLALLNERTGGSVTGQRLFASAIEKIFLA